MCAGVGSAAPLAVVFCSALELQLRYTAHHPHPCRVLGVVKPVLHSDP